MTEPIKMRLDANQLATMLILDGAISFLQIGANQLGGFLKLTAEADILMGAIEFIGTRKIALQKEWSGGIQVVQALPRLVNP